MNEKKDRIGEHFLKRGLISSDNLEKGLQRQAQIGGRLGSNLIEMGFVAVDDLLDFLSNKYSVPALNLFEVEISREILKLVKLDKIRRHRILPVMVDENTLTLAMANPLDLDAISDIQFTLGKKIRPVVVPAFIMDLAIHALQANPDSPFLGAALADTAMLGQGDKLPGIEQLLQYMIKIGANDLLLMAGAPPSLKISNRLRRLSIPSLTSADCELYIRELLPNEGWEKVAKKKDFGIGVSFSGLGRFRATVYRQQDTFAAAIRPIFDQVPSLEALNLPAGLSDFALRPHGLILVSGPAGHGKSTTMSAMVDIINSAKGANIITLEDPIEYLHKHKKGNISQREVGRDVESFSEGMRHVLRQAPDVIVVGEMRDKETFEIALRAANSGHLVISTVHSDNATSIIDRIINMFEPYEQHLIRMMLAESFLLSIAQRLVPKKNGEGRVLAMERLTNSSRVRKLIREGKTHQIRSQLQVGGEDFVSIDISLANLYKKGIIKYEDGLLFAVDDQFYQEMAGVPA